jgi:hypothetical protein
MRVGKGNEMIDVQEMIDAETSVGRYDDAPTYRVDGYGGIAFVFVGPQVERYWDLSEGIAWDDPEERLTGMVLMVMVGDDHRHVIDPADVHPLRRADFCPGCGQTGCVAYTYE